MLKLKNRLEVIQAFRKLVKRSLSHKHDQNGVSATIILLMAIKMINTGQTYDGCYTVGTISTVVGLKDIALDMIAFCYMENSFAERIVLSYI